MCECIVVLFFVECFEDWLDVVWEVVVCYCVGCVCMEVGEQCDCFFVILWFFDCVIVELDQFVQFVCCVWCFDFEVCDLFDFVCYLGEEWCGQCGVVCGCILDYDWNVDGI